ncbi:MAG: cytochrome C oxidase subunit IV family protein [Campylobacterota bacterium]
MMIIWLIMLSLTLFAFLLGWLELVSSMLVSVLLVSTYIKGQLVIDYFMGLKDVRLRYRVIPALWLIAVLSLIAVAYYLPVVDVK